MSNPFLGGGASVRGGAEALDEVRQQPQKDDDPVFGYHHQWTATSALRHPLHIQSLVSGILANPFHFKEKDVLNFLFVEFYQFVEVKSVWCVMMIVNFGD